MPYIMTAPQNYHHAFTYARVGTFDTFPEFLAAYPKMKAHYGDELGCAYIRKADFIEDDDWEE